MPLGGEPGSDPEPDLSVGFGLVHAVAIATERVLTRRRAFPCGPTFSGRMDNSVVLAFDDGKTAYYSAALLHATLPQAQMMPSDSEDTGLPHGE